MGAAVAYNLWASDYDMQTDNPLVFLDDIVFTQLLDDITLDGKTVVDIGCGTGRHWQKLLARKAALIGYEVSVEMLHKLHAKYPGAQTYLLNGHTLKELPDASCDVVVSTLVIGYIENLAGAFAEWNRVLKKNGEIIITDFHPVALQRGDTRSFRHNGQPVFIKNYIHPLDAIKALAHELLWEEKRMIEKKVDDSIKGFYEKQNVLAVYEKNYHSPLLYGWHFTKK